LSNTEIASKLIPTLLFISSLSRGIDSNLTLDIE